MIAGDTFLPVYPADNRHLYVVLHNDTADQEDGVFVAVNLTTLRENSDRTCVVRPGEHPFVRHESCAHYQAALYMTKKQFDVLSMHNILKQLDPASDELLAKLRRGAANSRFSSGKLKSLMNRILERE